MGLENPLHLLVLAVIILLVFGSSQLPKIARSAGKHAREAKDGVAAFKGEFDNALGGDDNPITQVTDTIRSANPKNVAKRHGQQDRQSHQEAAGPASGGSALGLDLSASGHGLHGGAGRAVDAQGRAVDVRRLRRGEEGHRRSDVVCGRECPARGRAPAAGSSPAIPGSVLPGQTALARMP